jgi:hypothetical protein
VNPEDSKTLEEAKKGDDNTSQVRFIAIVSTVKEYCFRLLIDLFIEPVLANNCK